MNMIKVLWRRFRQWQSLGMFTMFLVEGSSDTGLFRHLSNYVFQVRNIGNTKSMRVMFFGKHLQFKLYFKNEAKNWEKVFCFWNNCIWIGIVKLSLLRIGYLSLTSNVFTCSPKIWHVNKRDFFQLNYLASDQWTW